MAPSDDPDDLKTVATTSIDEALAATDAVIDRARTDGDRRGYSPCCTTRSLRR
jgi:hypothetical protein